MKRKLGVFSLGMALLLSLAACSSAPPETEQVPPPGPAPVPADSGPAPADSGPARPDQAALAGLEAARNRAEQVRQRAFDFGAPGYFPAEWEDADRQYRAVNPAPVASEEVRAASAAYDGAAAVFEELFRQSLPLYAGEREREILEARDAALGAGAEDFLPEFLVQADGTAVEALGQYEDGDYYGAAASAALARDLYGVLKTGAEAYVLRMEAEERDFYRYDPANFDLADESGNAAIAAYRAKDPASARDQAEAAMLRYNTVLATGRASVASERGSLAAEERRIALELKANVAVRLDFAAADRIYNKAVLAFAAGEYEMASDFYDEAWVSFIRTQRDTLEKRQAAEAAIQNAEEKMVESDETARNAELILEGGSR